MAFRTSTSGGSSCPYPFIFILSSLSKMESMASLLLPAICSASRDLRIHHSQLVIITLGKTDNFSMTFLVTICTSFIFEFILMINISKCKDLLKLRCVGHHLKFVCLVQQAVIFQPGPVWSFLKCTFGYVCHHTFVQFLQL